MNTSRPDSAPESQSTPRAPAEGHAAEEWDAALFARRPVQAVKVSYGAPWLHFLFGLSLAIAAWTLLWPLISRALWPKVASSEARNADSFVAISYEGISWKEGEVSPDRFREHLAALQAAGYVPINLRDVEELVCRGKPVPRKAVLVTMDHSRKTSYFLAHSILRRAGWNAVMFLWTKPILDGDSAAMLWPYLRNMLRSGIWEIGAQSHDGFRRVQTSSGGLLGGFMTSPLWLASEHRYESLEEFQRRLKADHDTCRALIKKNLGITPVAYAYPYGDFGQFQHRSFVTRPVNLGLVDERYPLAFILGNLALNTRHSDPHRLSRLLVQSSWSGDYLVERLERAWPNATPVLEKKGQPLVSAWIVDWGQMNRDPAGPISLSAATNATGAKMWLAGSDQMYDLIAKFRFRLDEGQLGLYLRASADGESYIYLGLDQGGEVWLGQMAGGKDRLAITEGEEDGGVWLRQKQAGGARFTLASSQVAINPSQDHVLEVFLRDRFFSARLDGQELFRSRNLLRGEMQPGLMGLSVWTPQKGRARAWLNGVEVKELTPTVASWTPNGKQDLHVFRWIFENAFRLTDISPKWLDASAAGLWSESGPEMGLYRMLAKVHHLRLLPQVSISDERGLHRITPALLAERVAREHLDGVLLNLTSMRNVAMPVLASWLRPCAATLAERGAKLLVQLPAVFETRSQVSALLAVMPGAQVTVEADSPVPVGPVMPSGRVVRAEAVPAAADDEPLPLFYVIPTAGEGGLIETDEAKSSRLQQEGMASFLDEQYDRAISTWREWRRLEPENPKVYMLIGDALARKGDLKAAVLEYDKSLDLDPGQIALVIRRAELYDSMGQPERTSSSLNLYARLFPGNADILMAQSRWLSDNGRQEEAVAATRKLVAVDPDNVDALALLLRLTTLPEEHRQTMEKFVAAGSIPKNQMALGRLVWRYALTAQPDADALHALVQRIAESTTDPRTAELYGRIMTRTDFVNEEFATGQLSTNRWWMEGAVLSSSGNGKMRFAAGEAYTEGSLRLLGSLRLHNVFIEALVVRPISGDFWLYSCRTPEHIARFGLTENGYLRLQTWRGKRLLAERKVEYQKPANPIRLRLETKGDGIMGYVDGRPMFDVSLPLSPAMGFGWVGLSVHATERGGASAEIAGIKAGPTPVRLGILAPAASETDADAQLTVVRQDVTSLTAICPSGYSIQPDGAWAALPGCDNPINSVFARYHRLWLMPYVDCRASSALKPEILETHAKELDADGFILMFKEWPGDAWISGLRKGLQSSPLRLVIASSDGTNSVARMQPLFRGFEFTTGTNNAVNAKIFLRRSFKDTAELTGESPVIIRY